MTPYSALCDDFSIYSHINFKLDQNWSRETVLHFFENLRKPFPMLMDLERKESGEHHLEEDREQGSFRWVSLDQKRLNAGFVNPPDLEAADSFHAKLLEVAPFFIDINPLDVDAVDVTFCFDFSYQGNHDEVVAEALGLSGPLEGLFNMPGSKVLGYEPAILLTLDDACRKQCCMSVETRTTPFMVRTGQYADLPITVYFTLRQYWSRNLSRDFSQSYQAQRAEAVELIDRHIVPGVIRPLTQTIAAKQ